LLIPSRRAARVVTIHDLDFLVHPKRTRAEIRRDYPRLARPHAHRADRIVVPSRYTASRVSELLGVPEARISVCPHGAPDWTPRAGPPTSGRYFLFLGTLEPRKNLGGLLDAYMRLRARCPDALPLVVGGKAPPEHEAWANGLLSAPGVAPYVQRLGYVPPERRRELYEGARALVYPSFDEGFGLPALEAMTLGVPVVASNRGALPEVVGEAGLLVEPEAEALAEAMSLVLTDEPRVRAMVTTGIERARRFTWRSAAEAARQAYAKAMASRSAAAGH
jgi:alpha-1,3-rhamnosyl/mannosyltransferase